MQHNSFHYNSFLNTRLFSYIYLWSLPERKRGKTRKFGSISQNIQNTTDRAHCNTREGQAPRIYPNCINSPSLDTCSCSISAFIFVLHYFKTSTLLLKNNCFHFIHLFQVLGYDALLKCRALKHFPKGADKLPPNTGKCRISSFCGDSDILPSRFQNKTENIKVLQNLGKKMKTENSSNKEHRAAQKKTQHSSNPINVIAQNLRCATYFFSATFWYHTYSYSTSVVCFFLPI